MLRESRVQENPNWDDVCFHAQQCAEKYLKAKLCEANIVFGKIHDLVYLLNIAVSVEPGWKEHQRFLAYLSDFAVSCRYPGDAADRNTAVGAIEYCCFFRKIARESFGLH